MQSSFRIESIFGMGSCGGNSIFTFFFGTSAGSAVLMLPRIFSKFRLDVWHFIQSLQPQTLLLLYKCTESRCNFFFVGTRKACDDTSTDRDVAFFKIFTFLAASTEMLQRSSEFCFRVILVDSFNLIGRGACPTINIFFSIHEKQSKIEIYKKILYFIIHRKCRIRNSNKWNRRWLLIQWTKIIAFRTKNSDSLSHMMCSHISMTCPWMKTLLENVGLWSLSCLYVIINLQFLVNIMALMDHLPNELLPLIFEHLDLKDLPNCRLGSL